MRMTSSQKFSKFLDLPTEIQTLILVHCNFVTLFRYSITSKDIREKLGSNKWFWELKTKKDFGKWYSKIELQPDGWKATYQNYRKEMGKELIDYIKGGSLKKTFRLLELGVDINERDEFGDTALIWACKKGHGEIVDKLLEARSDPNIGQCYRTPLMEASRGHEEYFEIVQTLLRAGADPNERTRVRVGGMTALSYAAEWGHIKIVQELLKNGANPNFGQGMEIALFWGNHKIANLLKQHQPQK